MPVFKTNMVFEVARGLKAFLNLEGGVTRSAASVPGRQKVQEPETDSKQIAELRRALESKDQEIARLNAELSDSDSNGPSMSIELEKLIWIFGTARVGSTWLAQMMSDLEGHTMWREPRVGALFGSYYYVRPRDEDSKNSHFILGSHREVWLRSIRSLVSDTAQATFSEKERQGYLVVKEPNGSVGAPLLMEAMPESKMILVIRDPRDVAASGLDAERADGWAAGHKYGGGQGDKKPDVVVRERAANYRRDVGNAMQAYESHEGSKALLKYEDLRSDTLETMKRVYSDLNMTVDEKELVRVMEKRSWENISEDKKGEGKFYRKATPGGWHSDLTPEQVEIVESVTAPLLEEFYPA